jgi:CRP/FNR family transcriptional regulator
MHPNERALRSSLLFAPIEPELFPRFAQASVRARYARGEPLWRARSPAVCFTIILSGLVKIAATQPDGTESIIAIFGPRESIGDMAALATKPYPADAVAITDAVEILRVDAATVRDATATHPALAAALNASLIQHSQALQDKIRIMAAGTVPKRLATLLLHLAARFGDEMEDGTTRIPIALSRAECARLVGATVETTIRTFSKWQKEALVATTGEGFVLDDLERLRAIVAGGDST